MEHPQIASLSEMADPVRQTQDTLEKVQFALGSIESERPLLGIHVPVDRFRHIHLPALDFHLNHLANLHPINF